jgi:succinate dehydrogenase/fumarate reductase flavoprotein subunit
MKKKDGNKNITRRNFVKASAIGLGTTAFLGAGSSFAKAGIGKASQQANIPTKWDYVTDVVVVGYGLAGAVAALSAREAGAEVIVLEKMPYGKEGGNSKVSGNMVFIPGNVEDGKAYFRSMCARNMDGITDELVDTWATEMVANRNWLASMGLTPVMLPPVAGMSPEIPYLPGASNMALYTMNGQVGNGVLWEPVNNKCVSSGAKFLFDAPATELIATCEHEVLGVVAKYQGKNVTIKANKGVILTCGGFEFNEAMKANYSPMPIYGLGTPGNTGDGIKMVEAVGADLWHMNNFMGPIMTSFITDDFGPDWATVPINIAVHGQNYIFLDKQGKRFMNEFKPSVHGHGWREIDLYDGSVGFYPRVPHWIVFDESAYKAGPLSGGEPLPGIPAMKMSWFGWFGPYKWSSDNSAELAKGWIKKANSLEELAQIFYTELSDELNTNEVKNNFKSADLTANVQETFSRYDKYVSNGKDLDFDRPAQTMKSLKGPFYAIQSYPCMVNTQGGPKRNHKAQVLNTYGNPIKRLYAAGECGSVYAWLYQGGGNLGECIAFGRIAGKNAAGESPSK